MLNRSIFCLTLDYRGRADLTRARRRRSALGRLRTLDLRAARARARRALTTGLITLATVENYGLRLGD